MSASKERKNPPKITEETDRPQQQFNGSEPARAVTPGQPEPKNFVDRVDLSKLQFGQKLIGWCIFLIIALSVLGYFFEREGTELSAAVELLKLVTTTALGFVFAKTQTTSNKEDDA